MPSPQMKPFVDRLKALLQGNKEDAVLLKKAKGAVRTAKENWKSAKLELVEAPKELKTAQKDLASSQSQLAQAQQSGTFVSGAEQLVKQHEEALRKAQARMKSAQVGMTTSTREVKKARETYAGEKSGEAPVKRARAERFEHFKGSMFATADHFQGAMDSAARGNQLGAARGLMGATGAVASNLPGGAGVAAEGLTKLGGAALDALGKIRDWTGGLHQANIRFAEFSGAMTGVMIRQNMREMMLSHQKGEALAGSAENLAKGKNELDRALAPWEAGMSKFFNDLGAKMSEGAAFNIKELNKLLGIKELGEEGESPTSYQNRFSKMSTDVLKELKTEAGRIEILNRPSRFN